MEAVLPPGIEASAVRGKEGFGLRLGGSNVPVKELFSLSGRTIISEL